MAAKLVLSEMTKCILTTLHQRMLVTRCMFYSKWRTTPVVEEAFAEVLALVAAVGAVDAAEAVEGAAVPGVANQRTRK